MAFIEKKDPVVLNIKLTSKGRELLSKGQLTFNYFCIGDSEIDYGFNKNAKFNSFFSNILRPADKNPKQLSFIPRNLSGDSYNLISSIPTTPTVIENQIQPIGFFNSSGTEILTDTDHVKQPDIAIYISGVTGGTKLKLNKASTFQGNVNEIELNDYLLVKWTNPLSPINTTGYSINKNNPTPYLIYKVLNIVSGSLSSDDLIVEVDRELPNFSNITGGSDNLISGAIGMYNYLNYTGETTYSTDNTDDAIITFLQNCQCPTTTYPFWNMSIIYTENIVGVQLDDKQYGDYATNGYGGFVSYIQNQSIEYNKRKLGLIHYTNESVANTYAEGFYGDPLNLEDANKIPTLNLPTIMWHKSNENTLGVTLKAYGKLKYLTGVTKSLNTKYYDLADESGNVVGKVFYDLKLFLIEDQELLFAMSYKSNRSWTLPNYGADINANVTFGCPDCLMKFDLTSTEPSKISEDDGELIISNITNSSLDSIPIKPLILEILSGSSGASNGTRIFFAPITGNTTVSKSNTINNFGISAGTYTIKLTDTTFGNCTVIGEIDVLSPTANTSIYEVETTYAGSGLEPYFKIEPYNDNPVRVRISAEENGIGAIGVPYGTAFVTVASTGITQTELNSRTLGGDVNGILNNWIEVPSNGYLDVTTLTFNKPYVVVARDSADAPSGQEFDSIVSGTTSSNPNIRAQVWGYYVSVATPFLAGSDVILTEGEDNVGKYIAVSNYLKSINSGVNPVVGNIEMAMFDSEGVDTEYNFATKWYQTPNDGTPFKIYLDDDIPNPQNDGWVVEIRERYGFIEMYKIRSNNFQFEIGR